MAGLSLGDATKEVARRDRVLAKPIARIAQQLLDSRERTSGQP
jgi:hypothetical protein